MPRDLTIEQVQTFLENKGKFGEKTTSIVEKHRKFSKAINTDIGKELLTDVISQMDRLLPDIIDLKASKKERLRYSILLNILSKWSRRIELYEEAKEKIRQG